MSGNEEWILDPVQFLTFFLVLLGSSLMQNGFKMIQFKMDIHLNDKMRSQDKLFRPEAETIKKNSCTLPCQIEAPGGIKRSRVTL